MSEPAASADALLVHSGGSRERGEPAVLPPVLATILSSAGVPRPEDYGRGGNPTWAVLEQALGGIEAAQAVVFSSGQAASMALMLALTSDRDRIVLPRDGYYLARVLADRLRPLGAASVAVDMCDLSAAEMARATVVGSFRVGRGTQTSCQRPGGSRLPFSSPTHHAMTAGGDQPRGERAQSRAVTPDLDSLATALYARTDDLLKQSPQLAPYRPEIGIEPQLSDAELVTLSVMQAMLGFTSERRWIRYARSHLRHLFPYLPKQPGYNKRLRKAADLIVRVNCLLAVDTTLWTDDVWVVDSTPVECGRSRETVERSDLAGWAEYGYCASHSRFFWGLRLHLVCTLHGLPIMFALTGAKADERETLLGMFDIEPELVAARPGQTLIGDKNYFGGNFERHLDELNVQLLRPARKGEAERAGSQLFKPLRQIIESVNETFKGQLDIERHRGRTPAGVTVRVLQRILALTAAIWHNDRTGQPTMRSLTAYDH